MYCERYLQIVKKVKDEIIKKYGTVKGQCQEGVKFLFKKGLYGIPFGFYFRHKDFSYHLVFITHDLCALDPTAEQYGYAPLVYKFEDLIKYYKIISYFKELNDDDFRSLSDREITNMERSLREYAYKKMREFGIPSDKEFFERLMKKFKEEKIYGL